MRRRPRRVIRTAVADDLPALADVFRRSSLSNDAERAQLLASPEVLELSPTAVLEGRTRVVVEDGRVLGFATTVDADDGDAELDDLFVDPDAMGRGLGRLLVADAVEQARGAGARRLVVTANLAARSFYEKVGFVADGPVATRFGPALRMHREVDRGTLGR